MRSTTLLWVMFCGLAFSGWAQAQTWKSPWVFNSATYVSQANSCGESWQTLDIPEAGEHLYGPLVVYRAVHSAPVSRLNRPWAVQVLPQFSFLDFSVWVCSDHIGTALYNCWDASDNGPGMANNVSVPGFYTTSWYVVVASNVLNQSQNCGPFTLIAVEQ
ncbi:MAG TPA: hypothetical protein VFB32_13530 [Rudaea sp.]|nr:hypothetical protein [Rudaea sp.]